MGSRGVLDVGDLSDKRAVDADAELADAAIGLIEGDFEIARSVDGNFRRTRRPGILIGAHFVVLDLFGGIADRRSHVVAVLEEHERVLGSAFFADVFLRAFEFNGESLEVEPVERERHGEIAELPGIDGTALLGFLRLLAPGNGREPFQRKIAAEVHFSFRVKLETNVVFAFALRRARIDRAARACGKDFAGSVRQRRSPRCGRHKSECQTHHERQRKQQRYKSH